MIVGEVEKEVERRNPPVETSSLGRIALGCEMRVPFTTPRVSTWLKGFPEHVRNVEAKLLMGEEGEEVR